MPPARSRSQRKASGLANAAIALQSSGDPYSTLRTGGQNGASSTAEGRGVGGSLRPLTVRERQLLDEERQEKEERERSAKRRKIQKRLHELERTNYRDAAVSLRPGTAESSRNDGEAFSIPNSALLALTGGADAEGSGTKQHKQSATVRRLLVYRKGFHSLLEDAASDEVYSKSPFNYEQASATIDKSRHRQGQAVGDPGGGGGGGSGGPLVVYESKPLFCSICGQSGSADCSRCGERLCGMGTCQETHNDARCDRPVR
ncbi:hypothetical protein BCV69DRAFT_279774 [Microstroma glucosiphilum]|uniref:HIT-type domain-containing protein n=1 Tax=Pseudomicrostroma glucosiphilum TaxID=1684307 RepID=A0A316UG28_9BASI|nr:hypothetical protein BCV69DRAFT_279774 [Pseudomicrostroma glucosiphilum]PWN23864.1 hypothetical protein BCV69DRAFT_279774 [Pseudomicrostroma glucosiphilum]